MNNKKGKSSILWIIIILIIAGAADIKYKGKLYQTLPSSVQSYLDKKLMETP